MKYSKIIEELCKDFGMTFEDGEYRKQRRASLPVRRAVHAFYQQHPEIQRIPVIHSV